jgi:hypothetical protein
MKLKSIIFQYIEKRVLDPYSPKWVEGAITFYSVFDCLKCVIDFEDTKPDTNMKYDKLEFDNYILHGVVPCKEHSCSVYECSVDYYTSNPIT